MSPIQWLVKTLLRKLFLLAVHFELQQLWSESWSVYGQEEDDYDYETDTGGTFDQYGNTDELSPDSNTDYEQPVEPINGGGSSDAVHQSNSNSAPPPPKYTPSNKTQPKPCTKRVHLYDLQPDRLNAGGLFNPLKAKLTNCHSSGCERPFSVQKIPHSNLILLVVDTLCPCGSSKFRITPEQVSGSDCRRKPQETMYRRKPPKCINYHPEEIEIKVCGRAYDISLSAALLATSLTLAVVRIFTNPLPT